jgi:hypothetical protein
VHAALFTSNEGLSSSKVGDEDGVARLAPGADLALGTLTMEPGRVSARFLGGGTQSGDVDGPRRLSIWHSPAQWIEAFFEQDGFQDLSFRPMVADEGLTDVSSLAA